VHQDSPGRLLVLLLLLLLLLFLLLNLLLLLIRPVCYKHLKLPTILLE
jgi:hypothetical protein